MGLVRNTMFVLIALFIDGLQAAISWGIAVIAAFPGTAAGGAAGCAAGDYVAGEIGCAVGGFVLGLLGTTGNALLAPFTIPIGIGIGFAVSTTLSIVLGWAFLVPLMFFFGIRPQRQLPWGLGEVIPGINNVPFWTFLTIATLLSNARSTKPKKSIFVFGKNILAPSVVLAGAGAPVQNTILEQPIATANDNISAEGEAEQSSQRNVAATPRMQLPNMSLDVRPPQAANENRQYAQAA